MDAAHIESLQRKHEGLERQISAELGRPMPDDGLLRDLKRRKLRLKEAIVSH